VNRVDAEELTQSLGQVGGGMWRLVLWAVRKGVPEALGLTTREWVTEYLGGYVQMSIDKRREVVAQLTAPVEEGGEGLSQREAADVVGVRRSQVNRDLVPNGTADNGVPQADDDSSPGNVPNGTAERVQELARAHEPDPEDTPPLPAGPFACIVIDPPWPVRKIERDTRPWQGSALEYPTMTLDEIGALPVVDLAADDAHLYLWVTHRFLPAGLDLATKWGFRYQCQMTWNKNTGIVPFSWMYDTEHVLFATRGNLKIAKRGLRLSFDEPVEGHSVKPEVFYDRVRAASPGPRLEMFARRARSGFEPWGAEVATA
jgi:N6-adenosine-specific RNA methylase IME4